MSPSKHSALFDELQIANHHVVWAWLNKALYEYQSTCVLSVSFVHYTKFPFVKATARAKKET